MFILQKKKNYYSLKNILTGMQKKSTAFILIEYVFFREVMASKGVFYNYSYSTSQIIFNTCKHTLWNTIHYCK